LVGTDYCEGVKGIGPKKALKLIKEHGSIERVLKILNVQLDVDPQIVKNIYLNPEVTSSYTIKWEEPDYDGILDMLCNEHDFSEERVKKALNELKEVLREEKGKTSLDAWF
ncbi:MAG: flap structure-specific endonuclease, partial [Nitrososphaerota archaeon]